MVFALPGGVLALLALIGCGGTFDPARAWPVTEVTEISTDRVDLSEKGPISYVPTSAPFARVDIENLGATPLFVTPAVTETQVVEHDSRLSAREVASLVVVDLPPFTEVLPGQRKPLQITLDNRKWRWASGTYHVRFPLEARYFYSGQDITDPEDSSRRIPPEPIADLFWIDVHFTIDCDLDDDGFDEFPCSGPDDVELDPARHPDAVERCNGKDDDMDGAIDEYAVDRTLWCEDADGDNFGNPDVCDLFCRNSQHNGPPAGWVENDDDCDDDDDFVRPGGIELICANGIDDDCDGLTDGADPDCG